MFRLIWAVSVRAHGILSYARLEIFKMLLSSFFPLLVLILAVLRILWTLVGAFLTGGIVGALGYATMGFLFSLPLAFILLGISVPALPAIKWRARGPRGGQS